MPVSVLDTRVTETDTWIGRDGLKREDTAMGTWGAGIFDDDVARDVQEQFDSIRQQGYSVSAATQQILKDPPWGSDDDEDAAVTYLALAALQLAHGELEPTLREKAIAVIASGVPMWRWDGSAPEGVAERTRVLEEPKEKLSTYPGVS
jgi:hypothetical protein